MELSARAISRAKQLNKAEIVYEARLDREIESNIEAYRAKMARLFAEAKVDERPRCILAEGDSWFRYVVGKSVTFFINKRPRTEVLNLASPGDAVKDMLSDKQRKRLAREFRRGPAVRRKYDGFLFSGGGNDLLGEGRFYRWLHDYESGMQAKDILNQTTLKAVLDFVEAGYHEVITIRDDNSPKTKIYMHGYDFAQPMGEGVCGRGPWLKPSLDARKVPVGLQPDVVKEFLKKFELRLKGIVRATENAELIQTQGTLAPQEWANEIHPKDRGFKKIAERFWKSIESDFP